MRQCIVASIAKLAVLMEDFSDIEILIESLAENHQKLRTIQSLYHPEQWLHQLYYLQKHLE